MNPLRGLCSIALFAAAVVDADAQISTTDCRLTAAWLPAVSAECGVLQVLEDPSGPGGGTEIELFVARVPSLNAAPQEDPLVVIAGGPGQAATDLYPQVRAAFEPIRRDRDILLVDQRGTGRSAPLTCPQVSAATVELVAEPESLPALMNACLGELDGDPRLYTTSIAVRDLELVREALGIEQWNLYGVSYGTRVAQHYLRRYPQRTRALILDGVVPNEAPLGPDVAAQSQRVLDLILSRCAMDGACADRYPDIATQLDALLNSLAQAPLSVDLPDPRSAVLQARQLSHAHVTAALRLLSYSPQTAALLPLLIDAAATGNLVPLAAQADMITSELEAALSLPMHNAVVCTEDVPFFAATTPEVEATYLGTTLVEALNAVCEVWPSGVLDADLREPLRADHPALLLSGDADPITPPDYAEQVLTGLSNARHLVGQGQGHGLAGVGCVPRLMREFLDELDPDLLDAACLERQQASPFFLDFNGPAP